MFEIGTANNYIDLLDKLHTFLTATGSAYGLTYSGTGNGTMINYKGGSSSVAETFTITATNSTTFSVVGSVSGSIGTATVGSTFSHAKLTFRINAGGTAFQAGDAFTLNTAPKWTAMRAKTTCISGYGGTMNNASYPARNAFDGTNNEAENNAATGTIYAQLNTATEIVTVKITGPNSTSEAPRNFTLEYSDDGSNWTVASTQTNVTWGSREIKTYTLISPGAHTYWRLNVSLNNGGGWTGIAELQLFNAAGDAIGFSVEYIWKAPGNDGAGAIYVGALSFYNVGADYYNWRLAGFTGYSSGSSFYSQPGVMARPVVPLWNSVIPYWFSCNGRDVRGAAKVSTVYEPFYLGFINSYLDPGQLPYPLAVGGAMAWYSSEPASNSATWRWSYNGYEHSAFSIGSMTTGSSNTDAGCQLRFRKPDGTWQGYIARYHNSAAYSSSVHGIMWPYANEMNNMRENLDGTYPLLPVVLQDPISVNTWGALDGIYATSGYAMGAESTINVGPIQYVVFPNIFRTEINNFFSLRLD